MIIDHCNFEDFSDGNDAVFAVDVEPRGHAVIQHSTFSRCGKVNGAAGGAIRYQTGSEGVIASTTVVDNYGAGIIRADIKVKLLGDNVVSRNGPGPRR